MDELEMPAVVGKLLSEFDGRPLDEVLSAIAAKERVTVDPSFVRRLTDFGVLRDDAIGGTVPRLRLLLGDLGAFHRSHAALHRLSVLIVDRLLLQIFDLLLGPLRIRLLALVCHTPLRV